ncbi:GLPGLI family protein [Chryseobacterium oleae]|uniref:GLPGLI family protein n=1 Tax=Chryseobacterium oleae TaxID=491207 RepID=A0A1I5ATY3_CHROL|nr:GLPGLI family protein [Chryseobacterium oleae]SFN65852.1 GLPGLI family protein [Chryseobacterium oleae]
MRNKFLIFFGLFLLTMYHGQTIRYIYQTSVNPDSINLVSLKSEKTFLDVRGNQSLFISENKLIKDSLWSANKGEEIKKEKKDISKSGIKKHPEPTFFDYYITKNIPEQKIYFYDRVLGKQIYYQEDRPVKWEITDVTELQNGYKAQKALTNFGGRIWTAWFTKDINVSDGPYKFSGLPGLIVKLEDDKGDYKFDLVKQMMIKNSFEEPIASDARQSTRVNFNGDKAALELEFSKNRRIAPGGDGGMQNFGSGGKHGGGMGGMRGGNHSGNGMSPRGMDGIDMSGPGSGMSSNSSFKNEISQNPIELK